jgi:hypothetical protein
MNEIKQRIVYDVDGKTFATIAAAQEFVANKERGMRLAELIHDKTNMDTLQAEECAEVIIEHWASIQSVMKMEWKR